MTNHNRVWQNLPKPTPGHPDESLLWEAERALDGIGELEANPDIKNAFAMRLKEFRSELEGAAALVARTEHSIAFIGDIGVGKTTAICRTAGLEMPADMPGTAMPTPVLEVGGGGTTICEVQIDSGTDYGLVIEPRNESELREEVNEFARLLTPEADSGPDDATRVAPEVSRAIRNMSGLQRSTQRGPDGRITGQIDPARDLAERLADSSALADAIWSKMAVHKRTLRELWYGNTSDQEPLAWLRENFRMLNNGRNPEISLPQRVEVVIPQRTLGDGLLSIRIVDTKGIDATAEREDLMVHLNEPNTVVVLCSPFNSAPVPSVQSILERSLEPHRGDSEKAHYRDLETRSAVLVLPRSGEALAVRDDSGDPVAITQDGYHYKGEQVALSLATAKLPGLRVEFFNTYEDDVSQVNSFLMEMVNGLRRINRKRLSVRVNEAFALVKNHENEQVRAVQKLAAVHLRTWLNNNRRPARFDGDLQDSLLREIRRVNHSTLAASVRRRGKWHNLDYSQQLIHGGRVVVASAIDPKLADFRKIIRNLHDTSHFQEAYGLLREVRRILNSGRESMLRAGEQMGKKVHAEYMWPDYQFWRRCMDERGRGEGYKWRVANHNRDWFANDQYGISAELKELVSNRWAEILSRIEAILPDDDEN